MNLCDLRYSQLTEAGGDGDESWNSVATGE
jgi:hypothetical protein